MQRPQNPAKPLGQDRLETPRLVLRRPVYADGPALHALLSDPDLCRYTPTIVSDSLATTHFTIVEWHEAQERNVQTYVAALHSEPSKAIGFIQVGAGGDVGGLLSERYAGNGYASEALNAVLAALGVFDSWTILDAEHEALILMLESVGYQRRKVLPRHRVHPQISSEARDCVLLRRTQI